MFAYKFRPYLNNRKTRLAHNIGDIPNHKLEDDWYRIPATESTPETHVYRYYYENYPSDVSRDLNNISRAYGLLNPELFKNKIIQVGRDSRLNNNILGVEAYGPDDIVQHLIYELAPDYIHNKTVNNDPIDIHHEASLLGDHSHDIHTFNKNLIDTIRKPNIINDYITHTAKKLGGIEYAFHPETGIFTLKDNEAREKFAEYLKNHLNSPLRETISKVLTGL